MYDPDRVRSLQRPRGLPFRIGKLGHVVLNVRDVERSARFYTEVLGFQISDVYPEEMVPGEIDLDTVPAQMLVRPEDLVERCHLERDMVEIGIRGRLRHRADQRNAVMIRVAA